MLKEKIIDKKDIKKLEASVKNQIEESVKFAKESPFPDPGRVEDDVYCLKEK